MAKKQSQAKWSELTREIIHALNIEEEYRQLGVEIVGTRANANGWLVVRAVGRPDDHPSAAINVGDDGRRGRYKDLGGEGDSLGLFDFSVKFGGGKFRDWKEARKHYAKVAGFARSMPKEDGDEARDRIKLLPDLSLDRHSKGFIQRFKGVTPEAVKLCGGVIGKYPVKSATPQYCVILPAYGPNLLDSDPRGYTLMDCAGGPIHVFQGEGIEPRQEKRINIGQSGLTGRYGLKRLDSSKTEVVWKVEGITDLLALQASIPQEYRERHIVITNNSGATETSLPQEVAPLFAGKTVLLIHDADEPGQDGAGVWLNALAGVQATVKNVQLPYAIEKNHGKDLRDWLNEGHSYAELLDLAAATVPIVESRLPKPSTVETAIPESNGDASNKNTHVEPEELKQPPQVGMTPHQLNLKRLQIVVMGELEGSNSIVCYSQALSKIFEIEDPTRLKLEHLLQHVGPHVEKIVSTGNHTDSSQIPIASIRSAIAVEGGRKTIKSSGQLGQGIWELNGRLVLVNAGEVGVLNGGFTRSKTPIVEGRLVDVRTSAPWFVFEEIEGLLKGASADWCQQQIRDAVDLFSKWDNWVYPDTPEIVASLSVCSWLQTIWEWRPLVAVCGPTNCGKSMLLEKCLPFVFGGLSMACSKPSEAGLRQMVGRTARIVLIDEFESDEHRQRVMELLRTSSRGSEIVRGTAGQSGILYGLRHIVWTGAIEMGMKREADRNRMVLLELASKAGPNRLRIPPREELRRLGIGLLVVGLKYWRECRAMATELASMTFEGVDSRVIESYSLPMAMLGCIHGETAVQASRRMRQAFGVRNLALDTTSDEHDLLEVILGSQVDIGGGKRMAVSELLAEQSLDSNVTLPADRMELLSRSGLKIRPNGDLFFSRATMARGILRGTTYQDQAIDQILLRVANAKRVQDRILGRVVRGVMVPHGSIRDILESVRRPDGRVANLDLDDGSAGIGDVSGF